MSTASPNLVISETYQIYLFACYRDPEPLKNARLEKSVTRKKCSVQRKMGVQKDAECVVLVTLADVGRLLCAAAFDEEKLKRWAR